MLASILAWLGSKAVLAAGAGFLDRFLGHLERQADSTAERERIAADRQKASEATAAGIVMAGMQHRVFWVAWAIAAVPTAAWYGWGMLDSLANGALPDVAALPGQLKGYADVVMGNIFYAGAALGAGQMVAAAIGRR